MPATTSVPMQRLPRVFIVLACTGALALPFGVTGAAQAAPGAPAPTPTRTAAPGAKPRPVVEVPPEYVSRLKPWDALGLDPDEATAMRLKLIESLRTNSVAGIAPAGFAALPPTALTGLTATAVSHLPSADWDVVSGPQALALAVPLVKVMASTADYAPTARRVVFLGHTLVNSSGGSATRPAVVQEAQRQIDDLVSDPVPASMQHAFSELLGALDAELSDEAAGAGTAAVGGSFASLVEVFKSLGRVVGIR